MHPGNAYPPSPAQDRRWRFWLALGAAAAVVVALVIALVISNESPNGAAAAPAAGAPASATSVSPSGENAVPGYYVAWRQAGKPYLDVRDTFTGQQVATVAAPDGVTLGGVYGTAADDRTFIVTGDRRSGAQAVTAWYLLLIAPHAKARVTLTPLPIPVS